jgi:predicted nucleic acid-binding protein
MILVDTSAWLALADSNDRAHASMRALYGRLSQGEFGKAVTTNYIQAETLTLVRRNLGVERAERMAEAFEKSRELRTFWIEPVHHHEAVQMMLRHGDKEWSVVDCSSFIVMKSLRIEKALTLDRDFAQAGFQIVV